MSKMLWRNLPICTMPLVNFDAWLMAAYKSEEVENAGQLDLESAQLWCLSIAGRGTDDMAA